MIVTGKITNDVEYITKLAFDENIAKRSPQIRDSIYDAVGRYIEFCDKHSEPGQVEERYNCFINTRRLVSSLIEIDKESKSSKDGIHVTSNRNKKAATDDHKQEEELNPQDIKLVIDIIGAPDEEEVDNEYIDLDAEEELYEEMAESEAEFINSDLFDELITNVWNDLIDESVISKMSGNDLFASKLFEALMAGFNLGYQAGYADAICNHGYGYDYWAGFDDGFNEGMMSDFDSDECPHVFDPDITDYCDGECENCPLDRDERSKNSKPTTNMLDGFLKKLKS